MSGPPQCFKVHWTVLQRQTDKLCLWVHPGRKSQRDYRKDGKYVFTFTVKNAVRHITLVTICCFQCGRIRIFPGVHEWATPKTLQLEWWVFPVDTRYNMNIQNLAPIFPNVHHLSPSQAYLHSMNVIHRDLNSHNCLVRQVNKWFHQYGVIYCKQTRFELGIDDQLLFWILLPMSKTTNIF